METISQARAHGGTQGVYKHDARTTACPMTFAVFVPPQAANGPVPVLWYLSGLTCTHANVMDKGEYRAAAAAHGVIIVAPDTSPRGPGIPDEEGNWQFGSGAGFYLDATQAPYDKNYRMWSYITEELPALIAEEFPSLFKRSKSGQTGWMEFHACHAAVLRGVGPWQSPEPSDASCSVFSGATTTSEHRS